jgi:6-pyruvoyltetrahydropterin/6-carboxytetrahydropterin synthase
MRSVEVDLSKERMKFSAGHFTIFSATERENLHGHNFTVGAVFTTAIPDRGLACDYAVLKKFVQAICDRLDEKLLLAQKNPHLEITEEGKQIRIRFAGEEMTLPAHDVCRLPIANVTIEELSMFFLGELLESLPSELRPLIQSVSVRISSGPGQGATSRWERADAER